LHILELLLIDPDHNKLNKYPGIYQQRTTAEMLRKLLGGRLTNISNVEDKAEVVTGVLKYFLTSVRENYIQDLPTYPEMMRHKLIVDRIKTTSHGVQRPKLKKTEVVNTVHKLTLGKKDMSTGLVLSRDLGLQRRQVMAATDKNPDVACEKLTRKGTVRDNHRLQQSLKVFWKKRTTLQNNSKEFYRDCTNGEHPRDTKGRLLRDKNGKKICTEECKIYQYWIRDKPITKLYKLFLSDYPQFKYVKKNRTKPAISKSKFNELVPPWVKKSRKEYCLCEYHGQYGNYLTALLKACIPRHKNCRCTCKFCGRGTLCRMAFNEMGQRPSLFMKQVIYFILFNIKKYDAENMMTRDILCFVNFSFCVKD